MSRTCGTFSRITGSSVSRAAAMQGSAAFFAPLIRTVPSSGLPPRITSLSMIYDLVLRRPLLYEPLPNGVDEIRVSGCHTRTAYLQGDLSTMICGVKEYV